MEGTSFYILVVPVNVYWKSHTITVKFEHGLQQHSFMPLNYEIRGNIRDVEIKVTLVME